MSEKRTTVDEKLDWQGMLVGMMTVNTALSQKGSAGEKTLLEITTVNIRSTARDCLKIVQLDWTMLMFG